MYLKINRNKNVRIDNRQLANSTNMEVDIFLLMFALFLLSEFKLLLISDLRVVYSLSIYLYCHSESP